ncbi:MAG TPA: DUF4197 domain-containing protein [Sphingobacteriaceae bacterium]|nr:DUF4197 domain-containing protein [Sphingobacteriaceae bacterium]
MKIKTIKLKYMVFGALMSTVSFSSCDALSQLPNGGGVGAGTTGNTSSTGSISSGEAASGIKQALGQGLEKSIQSLAVRDGFLGNAAVKILMPPEAQNIERTLRSVGLGSLVDDFITNLNRAAETAVKEASPVFVSSLSQLTVTDAFNILLSGQEDAATQFFRRTTTDQLVGKFSPIVDQAIGQHQVARHWSNLVTRYNQIPLVNEKIETDLTKYVTERAIDGLFHQVAVEELKIRNNLGGSRSTPLLQKVFDYADKH